MKHNKLSFTLVSGTIALLIAMGIGRFSYTPLLPYMKQSLGFSETMAGYLASSNYLGYLLGALFTGAIRWGNKRILYFRISLFFNILTTGLMGCTTNQGFWLLWRFLSGFSRCNGIRSGFWHCFRSVSQLPANELGWVLLRRSRMGNLF
jgi:MFS family permease